MYHWYSHNQFLTFVRKRLVRHYGSCERREELRHYGPMIARILSVDLSKVRDILKGQYSSSQKGKRGLRSCLYV